MSILEIPSDERFLIQARHSSLQRAADQPLFPYYYGIKRAPILKKIILG